MTAADLAELPIIGMPQDANAYHSIINWFEEAQVSPGLVHRCNSFSVVALLVRRGVGISLLPPEFFAGDLDSGALKVLIEQPAAAQCGLFSRLFAGGRCLDPSRSRRDCAGGKLVLRPAANPQQELRHRAVPGLAGSHGLQRQQCLERFSSETDPGSPEPVCRVSIGFVGAKIPKIIKRVGVVFHGRGFRIMSERLTIRFSSAWLSILHRNRLRIRFASGRSERAAKARVNFVRGPW